MFDADVHDDGMDDQEEDPRAFAKGALLYTLLYQNPEIAKTFSAFTQPGIDLAPFIRVAAAEERGDENDRMSLDEIGRDRTILSNKLAVTVHWQEFSGYVIRTSYGMVESQNNNTLSVRPDQLEAALEQMDDEQVDLLLEMALGTDIDEPWKESLFIDEHERAEREQKAFLAVQSQIVLNLMKINASLRGDISNEVELQRHPASILRVSLGIVNERTHEPVGNMATVDSPESIACELAAQVRWSKGIHWNSTMPKELTQERWRLASIHPELLLEAATQLKPAYRHFLAKKLTTSARARGMKSIAMAQATLPHFNESGIYTRTLRERLNEVYHQIAFDQI